MPAVVCVLRSGGEYQVEHVRALHAMVRAWWPERAKLRFVVLSDIEFALPGVEVRALREPQWKGWWSKLELFSARHDDLGDMWYFDLDTIIIGSLLPFLTHFGYQRPDPRKPILLQDFYHSERVNSGMMYLPKACRPQVQAVLLDDTYWAQRRKDGEAVVPFDVTHEFAGDGDLLDALWRHSAARWQAVLPGHVLSYKVDVRRALSSVQSLARIVCFHGQPRPWDTVLWKSWVLPNLTPVS